MADTVPTMAQITDAVKTAIEAVSSPVNLSGLVFDRVPRFDSVWEELKTFQSLPSGQLDVVYVTCEEVDEVEPDDGASGEVYSLFNVSIRYWSVRSNVEDWDLDARAVAESIRSAVSKNQSIFSIGGKRQLVTPETVTVQEQGFAEEADEHGDPQRFWKSEMRAVVEGRRFS